jgi:hypothetical protein
MQRMCQIWSHTVQLLNLFIGAMQQVVKPFSGRVALKGKTVAGCTPSQGTVSAASIGDASSSGPGPDFFTAPDSATCCASAPLSTATSFSAEPHTHCESQA